VCEFRKLVGVSLHRPPGQLILLKVHIYSRTARIDSAFHDLGYSSCQYYTWLVAPLRSRSEWSEPTPHNRSSPLNIKRHLPQAASHQNVDLPGISFSTPWSPGLRTCLTIVSTRTGASNCHLHARSSVTHAAAVNTDRRSASAWLRTHFHDDERIFVTTWPCRRQFHVRAMGKSITGTRCLIVVDKDRRIYKNHGRFRRRPPGIHTTIAGR
jgi:hypothetical protein